MRDLVFICELLRIEEGLQRCGLFEAEGDVIMYELLLGQFELLLDRLSPEDDELWVHALRIIEWMRIDAMYLADALKAELAASESPANSAKLL